MSFPILTDLREPVGMTFAEPGSGRGFAANLASAPGDIYNDPAKYGHIVSTADRSVMLTGTITSEAVAREEAYDRRIAAIKAAGGPDLENPERGGYAREARDAIRDEMRAGGLHTIDETGGIPAYQRRMFDQRAAEQQQKYPDLAFGDLDEEARAIAKGASVAAGKSMEDANPVAAFGAAFVGGVMGMRRDPLFIGSLFAGPTAAAGKTALARIASSAWAQGLFNAGLSAAEQPAVQDWRGRIGLESGVMPAVADVGLAFLTGLIPGAAIQGVREAARPLKRLIAGAPEAGDSAAVSRAIGAPESPELASAMRAGEEAVAADRAILSERAAKGVTPELHDDLMGAALKRADDPQAASPEAVAATVRREPPSTPETAELQARIDEAQPKTEREAQAAADEALDDFGNRDMMAKLRETMDVERTASADARTARLTEEPEKVARGDPMGKVPFVRADGTPVTMTRKAIAAIGERDDMLAMLVRSCK